MGFSHGTEIFDRTAEALFNEKINIEKIENILMELYDALRDIDWDTFDESVFVDDDWFMNIQKRLGYDYEDEEE